MTLMQLVGREGGLRAAKKNASARTAYSRKSFVDFGDPQSVRSLKEALHGGLGSARTLDLSIDDDILTFPGDKNELWDILGAVASDARLAMADGGVLQMCALNVFDRCGGDHDQVMIVVSYAARRDHSSDIAMGVGLHRAMEFAATWNAESELILSEGDETTLCLVHPTISRCNGG